MYQVRVFGIFVPLIEVMSSVALALIVWYGGGQVIRNYMTLGALTAFIAYMRLFFQPIREFSQKYTIVQSAMASAERIFQLLEEKDYMPQVIDPVSLLGISGHIEFRDVVFSYEAGRPALKNISFEVIARPYSCHYRGDRIGKDHYHQSSGKILRSCSRGVSFWTAWTCAGSSRIGCANTLGL